MRMWMLNPKFMCRKHLMGEHVEIHMFVGAIKKRKSLNGFFDKKILEIKSIYKRHEELIKEIKDRGYNHNSELPLLSNEDYKYYDDFLNCEVDKNISFNELFNRCNECKEMIIRKD